MKPFVLSRIAAVTLSAALLAGCGTTLSTESEYNEDFHRFYQINPVSADDTVQEINLPALGTEASAEVGRSLISKSVMRQLSYLQVAEGRTLVFNYDRYLDFAVELPAGVYHHHGIDSSGGKYFTSSDKLRARYIERDKPNKPGNAKLYNGGILVDSAGQPFVYMFWHGHSEAFRIRLTDLSFSQRTVTAPSESSSLRRELVYLGRSQNTISLLYREFFRDMVRPAFSQPLQYDVSTSPLIGFRGARFEVLRADGVGITYRTLKHMD